MHDSHHFVPFTTTLPSSDKNLLPARPPVLSAARVIKTDSFVPMIKRLVDDVGPMKDSAFVGTTIPSRAAVMVRIPNNAFVVFIGVSSVALLIMSATEPPVIGRVIRICFLRARLY